MNKYSVNKYLTNNYKGSECEYADCKFPTASWSNCQGWGRKAPLNFIPYKSESSYIADTNWFKDYEEDDFELMANATIIKYLEKAAETPKNSESSNDGSKSSRSTAKPEKEIKLLHSDDYEIHTITEESEQVTQSDIKVLTPSSFSSKPITPNKRYSSSEDTSGKVLTYPKVRILFPNTAAADKENCDKEAPRAEKVFELNTKMQNERYGLDVINENNNVSMLSVTDKLKTILK